MSKRDQTTHQTRFCPCGNCDHETYCEPFRLNGPYGGETFLCWLCRKIPTSHVNQLAGEPTKDILAHISLVGNLILDQLDALSRAEGDPN